MLWGKMKLEGGLEVKDGKRDLKWGLENASLGTGFGVRSQVIVLVDLELCI
jgi:hypothetical protein